MKEKDFLINIHDIIEVDFFESSKAKWIISEILKYFKKYHTTPTLEVLKVEIKKIENEVLQIAVIEQLKESHLISENDSDYVKEEFTNFCKNQMLKKALLEGVDLLHNGNFDGIRTVINNALKAGSDKNIGHEYSKDIEARYRDEYREIVIPTPWDTINELLQGGLGSGDLGLIFGNPGGGKSWNLVALAGWAVRLGYNVIYYTLELGENYVGRRFDAFFTGISVSQVTLHKDKIKEVVDQLPGNLVVKEYPTGKASSTTLEAHISKATELGVKPDLIIIDYIDLLRAQKTNKNSDRKSQIDDIYIDIKGLAKELKIPIWTASQVNREGSKEKIIEGDKAAASYDKMFITDFAMSLSRNKEDKVHGKGRYHIMKNRYGGDGMSFRANADTSTGHFEILGEYYGDEEEDQIPVAKKPKMIEGPLNNDEKRALASKFFNLNEE